MMKLMQGGGGHITKSDESVTATSEQRPVAHEVRAMTSNSHLQQRSATPPAICSQRVTDG